MDTISTTFDSNFANEILMRENMFNWNPYENIKLKDYHNVQLLDANHLIVDANVTFSTA